ncbi:transcription factor MYB73-like [Oryza glaberrima]|uniref:Myb-like domain-containing protein n=1 Tax=Oryza glaberrima TaxID=4538 RepID=I1Q184_ORYGL|nr:transcription factor MYB73-like [Oryza glaberrima]
MDMEFSSSSSSSSTTVASSPASSPPLGRCVLRFRLPPAWTPEEDAVLERLAMEHGSRHWRRVAAQMPRRRSPAQCRDRWRDHLARDVFHRPFTVADDAELARLCLRLDDDAGFAAGRRWKDVSRAVYGRSSCAVKRRWRELRRSDAFLGALWRPRTTTTAPPANAAITTTC